MKVLFLDESGDHSLDPINPDYPVFVLGGVIVDRTYARTVMERRVRRLKREFFGNEDVILHTAEIVRWKNDFAFMKDNEELKARFITALTEMMDELEYQVIACVIDKKAYVEKYGADADIYQQCLRFLLERFCYEVGNNPDSGIVYAETRRPDLDAELNMAWEKVIKADGLRYAGPTMLNTRIVDLVLKDKKTNIAGMQLADLVVTPIGRRALRKPRHDDWRVVRRKFRRRPGSTSIMGTGLIVFPRKK